MHDIVTLILYCRIYSFHYSEIIEKNLIIKKVVIFQPCLKKTFVDIRNRRLFNVEKMQQTLALHCNKHLQKIRPYNIIKYGQCMIIHNIT